jgi:acetyl esterase/lipase
MIGGGGLPPFGDSAFTSSALCGERPDGDATADDTSILQLRSYLGDTPIEDPRVAPGVDPQVLSRFPPSLLIAGSRDFAASSLTTLHRRLVAQQVHAELFLFDGLWHAFHIFPDLPESKEVYGLLANFFERTLTASASGNRQ